MPLPPVSTWRRIGPETLNPDFGTTITGMPIDPLIRWQVSQWQISWASGSAVHWYVIAPHAHRPEIIVASWFPGAKMSRR
jgi:hypothetical protein